MWKYNGLNLKGFSFYHKDSYKVKTFGRTKRYVILPDGSIFTLTHIKNVILGLSIKCGYRQFERGISSYHIGITFDDPYVHHNFGVNDTNHRTQEDMEQIVFENALHAFIDPQLGILRRKLVHDHDRQKKEETRRYFEKRNAKVPG